MKNSKDAASQPTHYPPQTIKVFYNFNKRGPNSCLGLSLFPFPHRSALLFALLRHPDFYGGHHKGPFRFIQGKILARWPVKFLEAIVGDVGLAIAPLN